MIKKVHKIKKSKIIPRTGCIHIKSTFNNTIINITDLKGNALFINSTGSCGFKGAKKRTPFAAESAASKIGFHAYIQGIKKVSIFLSGPGTGRESALDALKVCGFTFFKIHEIMLNPHNGCRPRKKRRI